MRRQARNTHIESSLPFWQVQPATRRGYVKVTCPRRDCRMSFWVARSWTTGKNRPDFIGRSCPWCFKVARLPNTHTRSKP